MIILSQSNITCDAVLQRKKLREETDVIRKRKHSSIFQRELRLTKLAAILLCYFLISYIPIVAYLYAAVLCKRCHINKYIR